MVNVEAQQVTAAVLTTAWSAIFDNTSTPNLVPLIVLSAKELHRLTAFLDSFSDQALPIIVSATEDRALIEALR